MPHHICITCGIQYADTPSPPAQCLICSDERQSIGPQGQQWTTLTELQRTHHNRIKFLEPHLLGIGTEPPFAIGQRALLVQTPAGNILWDCVSLIDAKTIEAVHALGGIAAIAVSHPHLVGAVVAWSHAFDNAPIYWHRDDRAWVMRPDPAFVFWEGESHTLHDDLTLVRCGGHFEGSSVLLWAHGAEGRGVLLTGDTIQVVLDHRYVSFMYSYPNLIPLNAAAIHRILRAIDPYPFDRIYGGWWPSIVTVDAKKAVARSAERYLTHMTDHSLS